ncbi:MAG: UDP-N-acetylmuramate--L-alanine ligase [Planctomycetota bacterium]
MDTDPKLNPNVRATGKERFAGLRVHLIGVGGSGMRALAGVLLAHGAIVSGSDSTTSSALNRLAGAGADIHVGQKGENVPEACDLVVHSAAIHEQNPELLAAQNRGIEILKYSQMLGMVMAEKIGIAVAGTHGKSTTAAMIAHVLRQAGKDPSFIVGATVEQLGGPSGVGAGEHFVAEACEFDRSFLHLSPHYATILNLEEDHLDCFEDLPAIIEAFRAFVGRIAPEGVLIANGEDRHVLEAARDAACEVQTFGLADGCTWQGIVQETVAGRAIMDVRFEDKRYGRLVVPLAGVHNAYNALAATAICHHAGLNCKETATRLADFTGAHRRMTLKGQIADVTVVDDFAHHPTEIQATLRALHQAYNPKRVVCVFQPHQHSRTRFLLKDFARSFGLADEVIVPDIYFVRDSLLEKDYISSADLVAQIRLNGGSATYMETFDHIVNHLQRTLQDGDLLVTMGAGDIWKVADVIIRWLGTSRNG